MSESRTTSTEGLPEWPEDGDLSGFADEELSAAETALIDELAEAMAADDDDIDFAAADELGNRIEAVRAEAAVRLANAAEPAEPTEPEVTEPEPEPTLSAEDRTARLAALRGIGTTSAPAGAEVELHTIDTAAVAEATARGMSDALSPFLEANREMLSEIRELRSERIPAQARRPVSARELAQYQADDRRGEVALPGGVGYTPPTPRGKLIHDGSVPGFTNGEPLESMDDVVKAFSRKHRDLGTSAGADEKVQVAHYEAPDPPPERDFRGLTVDEQVKRVRALVASSAIGVDPWNPGRELPLGLGGIILANPDQALTASGGLAAPVEPFYGQPTVAESGKPFFSAMPGLVANRGGIRGVIPPTLGTLAQGAASIQGFYADGAGVVSGSAFTSTNAAFTQADAGKPIVEYVNGVPATASNYTCIPPNTIINSVSSGTATLSATIKAASPVSFYLPARNPQNIGPAVGLVSAAADAAGPPNSLKFTYDISNGNVYEHDVYSIYTSLQFANLTGRTFPEQVEANITVAAALADRVAEAAAMDYVTAWSTLMTSPKTFGTARQLLSQLDKMAYMIRNVHRMNPSRALRVALPAWVLAAMRGDIVSTFMGSTADWSISDDELTAFFQKRNLIPTFFWDSPSDVAQLFTGPPSTATNVGTAGYATPVALPDYPGSGSTTSFRTQVAAYMWPEGAWLGLTTGELNVGLVRDSQLNSENRFRNFQEVWESPAYVGPCSYRCIFTVAADGSYGASASVSLGAGSGL